MAAEVTLSTVAPESLAGFVISPLRLISSMARAHHRASFWQSMILFAVARNSIPN